MTALAAVLDEMANTLQAAVDSDTDLLAAEIAVQVWPRILYTPSQIAIDMWPGDPQSDASATGFTSQSGIEFYSVRARITGDQVADQDFLLRLMSRGDPLNVQTVLEEDDTLNGLVTSLSVGEPSGFTEFIDSPAQGKMIGVLWQIKLLNAAT